MRKTRPTHKVIVDDPKIWQNIVTWIALAALTVASIYVLATAPENANAPNDLTHIVAWAAKGFVMTVIAFGTPMFLLGGVRRSPVQSWLMPHVETVKQVSMRVKEKLKTGRALTEGEYHFVGNLSLHIAIRVAGIAIFAGLFLLRF